MKCGYDQESFWDQTPHTLTLAFEAHRERSIVEHNERAWLAFHVAALQRTRKFPPLRRLMMRDRRPQSWQQQLAIAKQLTHAMGGMIISGDGKLDD